MKPIYCVGALTLLTPVLSVLLFAEPIAAQAPQPSTPATLANETPAQTTPVTDSFDYIRRDVMIPMRDGVKLHTVILVPKGAKNAPILLTRTPYDATDLTSHAHSSHLGPI
ncbi:MAG: cocE 3, partial [Candidatus Acidoferrum typicum]|nr:cocE 3 [Candidatus Acidoferrum typicum]